MKSIKLLMAVLAALAFSPLFTACYDLGYDSVVNSEFYSSESYETEVIEHYEYFPAFHIGCDAHGGSYVLNAYDKDLLIISNGLSAPVCAGIPASYKVILNPIRLPPGEDIDWNRFALNGFPDPRDYPGNLLHNDADNTIDPDDIRIGYYPALILMSNVDYSVYEKIKNYILAYKFAVPGNINNVAPVAYNSGNGNYTSRVTYVTDKKNYVYTLTASYEQNGGVLFVSIFRSGEAAK